MFAKLRLKLALLNAAVAGLILLAISAVAFVALTQVVKRQSEQMIDAIANDLLSSPIGTSMDAGGYSPYLVISLNRSSYQMMADLRINLSNDEVAELVRMAAEKENRFLSQLYAEPNAQRQMKMLADHPRSDVVELGGRRFRYSISRLWQGSGVVIVILDMEQETAFLRNLGLALGGCVLAGLLLTLLGGLFLAERSLRPIRAAWQKQRTFVADASHELRSPLAAIRCNLDVVLDDPNARVGDMQPFWEGISEETGRLTRLVDELLLLARADSDAVVLQRERVAMADVARAAVSFLQPMAGAKGIALTLEESGAPVVTGDGARLKQVLIALIDNAVKYTPEGGSVAVRVRRVKERALVDVCDTGIGIAREHLGRIFERFYRVDTARGRETGGHGLGLSIARWIVEQHGGALTVASEPGKGSCFTVSVPCMKLLPPAAEGAHKEGA